METKPKPHASNSKIKSPRVRKLISGLKSRFFIVTICIFIGAMVYLSTIWNQDSGEAKALVGEWAREKGYFHAKSQGGLVKSLLLAPLNLVRFNNTQKIPEIFIDIKFKHLSKLHTKKADALKKGLLITSPDDFVPASIRKGHRSVKVKIRLKGDHVDHLQGNKWSFRIHVKGEDHLFGLRRFSIQAPWTREFHGDILFFETLRYLGVLTPRYFFLDVKVNGKDLGIMALEEHFSKELLQENGRREGVIIKFDESLFWDHNQDPVFNNYQNATIRAFRSSRIKRSTRLSKDYSIAVGLLRGFINKTLPASKVFNVEQIGRFLAAAEIWGASHPISWHNERFYLNPISLKLEPIGFDASISIRNKGLPTLAGEMLIAKESPSTAAMLNDPEVFEVYSKTLKRLAKDIVNGNLLNKLREIEKKILPLLSKEYFLLSELPWDDLVARAKSIIKLKVENLPPIGIPQKPSIINYSSIIHAYKIKNIRGSYLEIANAVPQPVEIISLNWVLTKGGNVMPFDTKEKLNFPIILPPTPVLALPKAIQIYYPPQNGNEYSIKVTAKILGGEKLYEVAAQSYFPPLNKHPIPTSTVAFQLKQHRFLSIKNNFEKILLVHPGQWKVNGSLIIPDGYRLTIPGNTILRFAEKEGLIAHGPLEFQGTENSPILLEGQTTGKEGLWQGVVVLNSEIPSHWSFVTIRNSTGIRRPNWELTGGVTFYQSEVDMNHCSFLGHRGEDALNIVNSKFSLKNVRIENTASDGFDADFSEGTVEKGVFTNIGRTGGGDGVDFSGSRVSITGSRFQNISDKAISIGEQSIITAKDILMEKIGTGAASKDGSRLMISSTNIKYANNAGLMAYVKKPEYGPAAINAQDIKFTDTDIPAKVQTGSSVILEGKPIKTEDMDVNKFYETNMKPGLK